MGVREGLAGDCKMMSFLIVLLTGHCYGFLFLAGKPEEKKELGRSTCKWMDV